MHTESSISRLKSMGPERTSVPLYLIRWLGGERGGVPSNFRNISFFVIVKRNIDPPSRIVPDTWHGLNELGEGLSREFQRLDFPFSRKRGAFLRAAFHSLRRPISCQFEPFLSGYLYAKRHKSLRKVSDRFQEGTFLAEKNVMCHSFTDHHAIIENKEHIR